MNLPSLIQELFINSNKLITNNLSSLLVVALLYLLSTTAGTWLETNSNLFTTEINLILGAASLVTNLFVYYLLTKAALKLWGEQKVSLDNLQPNLSEFIRYLIVSVLYVLLIAVGILLLVIPGIYFATKYFFVSYLVLDKKLSIKESFKESTKLAAGKKLMLLPFFLLTTVPMILISVLLYNRIPQYLLNIIYLPWTIYTMIFLVGLYEKFESRKT